MHELLMEVVGIRLQTTDFSAKMFILSYIENELVPTPQRPLSDVLANQERTRRT